MLIFLILQKAEKEENNHTPKRLATEFVTLDLTYEAERLHVQ